MKTNDSSYKVTFVSNSVIPSKPADPLTEFGRFHFWATFRPSNSLTFPPLSRVLIQRGNSKLSLTFVWHRGKVSPSLNTRLFGIYRDCDCPGPAGPVSSVTTLVDNLESSESCNLGKPSKLRLRSSLAVFPGSTYTLPGTAVPEFGHGLDRCSFVSAIFPCQGI
ncbi:hypothetical protein J6590_055490 [Homalodisca vitripennis]|nr:hypothetical protein J6590_055490 [Homalodisca vitripennis]